MSKDTTIVEQASRILAQEDVISNMETKLLNYQTELEKANKLKEKWYELYKARSEAIRFNKQDAKEFAKKYTEAVQKYPKGFWQRVKFLIFGGI